MTVADRTTEADCFVLRDLVLRMYWDGEETPSVEVPLGDFFCCGFAHECTVNSLPIVAVPNRGLNSYFQMPFRKKAKITLENQHANDISDFFYQIDYGIFDEDFGQDIAYFHAQWRRGEDHAAAERLCDLGQCQRKGALCRHISGADNIGKILVGRR